MQQKSYSSKGQTLPIASSVNKITQMLKQIGINRKQTNSIKNQGVKNQQTLRKVSHSNLNQGSNLSKHFSNKENNNFAVNNQQNKNMNILMKKCNTNGNSNNSSRYEQSSKMQQLKNRFNRIKNSYDTNHQNLRNNLQINDRNGNYRNNERNQIGLRVMGNNNNFVNRNMDQQNEEVNEFSINQEEQLTFQQYQGRGYANKSSREQVEHYSFNNGVINNPHTNNYKNALQHSLNVSQVGQVHQEQSQLSLQQDRDTQGLNSNQIRISKKYRSLSRQLKTVKHSQLIQILLQQIQDNEKNKHFIQTQDMKINEITRSLSKKQEQIKNYANQIEAKRSQIEVLLITQKKNLDLIQKLKSPNSNCSSTCQQKQRILETKIYQLKQKLENPNCSKIACLQKQKLLEQKIMELKNKIQTIELKTKSQGSKCSALCKQRQYELQEKIQSLKHQTILGKCEGACLQKQYQLQTKINELKIQSQIPKCSQTCIQTKHNLQSKIHQLSMKLATIPKFPSLLNEFSFSSSHTPSFSTPPLVASHLNNMTKQSSLPSPTSSSSSSNQTLYYKQKHQQLQKYMNQYISNVNQAYKQFNNTISKLKQTNVSLKQQSIQMSDQLKEWINKFSDIKNQNYQLKQNIKKLNTSLNNSRKFIRELENEFVQLKDEFERQRSEIEGKEDISQLSEKIHVLKEEIGRMNKENLQLKNQNKQLNAQMQQIQTKIMQNNQIQQQVKLLFNQLNQQKSKLEKHQDQLKQEIKISQQKISTLNTTIKTLQQDLNKHKKSLKQKDLQIQSIKNQFTQRTVNMTQKQQMLVQQCMILQQTNKQLENLQQDLLQEYNKKIDQNERLKQELISIMNQVKQINQIYGKELSMNQNIRKELEMFWVSRLEKENGQDKKDNGLSQSQNNRKSRKCGGIFNQRRMNKNPSEKSSSSLASTSKQQNHNQCKQNSQISFKRGSLMTKQGSSSLFKNNQSFGQAAVYQSKSQFNERQNLQGLLSSVQGSIISQKFYTSEDSQTHNELKILQSSKKSNQMVEYLRQQVNKQVKSNGSKNGQSLKIRSNQIQRQYVPIKK